MPNFFDKTYQEPPINEALFGLCDDNKPSGVAFTDKIDQVKWIAIVENPFHFTVIFTPIDKGGLYAGLYEFQFTETAS